MTLGNNISRPSSGSSRQLKTVLLLMNTQFLQGSDPNDINTKYRIFISLNNVVYEVDEKKLNPIGRMDKLTKGCGFPAR